MRLLATVMHAVSSVFGCTHDKTSRPFTIDNQSYMACLACGQKVFYSPITMRRLSRRELTGLRRTQAAAPHTRAA
jgi:DNA-directed RNA polymerase subunit RPC12/RpoP